MLASFLIVLLTPRFIPVTVQDRAGLQDLHLGWPFAFLEQDQSTRTPPDDWFPHDVVALLPQEHPTRIDPVRLVLSVASVTALLFGLDSVLSLISMPGRPRNQTWP